MASLVNYLALFLKEEKYAIEPVLTKTNDAFVTLVLLKKAKNSIQII